MCLCARQKVSLAQNLISTSLTSPATVGEQDDINNQENDHDIDNTVQKVAAYCATHTILLKFSGVFKKN